MNKAKLFNNGTIEATLYPEGWVFLRWVNNKHGRLQKKLVKDLKMIEAYILTFKLKGWFTSSEIAHKDFQMLLHKVGAKFMNKDTDFIYFQKWIQNEGDLYVRKSSGRTTVAPIS